MESVVPPGAAPVSEEKRLVSVWKLGCANAHTERREQDHFNGMKVKLVGRLSSGRGTGPYQEVNSFDCE